MLGASPTLPPPTGARSRPRSPLPTSRGPSWSNPRVMHLMHPTLLPWRLQPRPSCGCACLRSWGRRKHDAPPTLPPLRRRPAPQPLPARLGCRGLASDAAADAYAAAGEAGVPACVMAFEGLTALEPALLALHAHSPSTTLVLDHCGFVGVGSLPSGDDAAALIRLAAAVPSLAVKASAWFRVAGNGQPSDCGPLLRFLVDTVGADRVAWGTDWPWSRRPGPAMATRGGGWTSGWRTGS